MQCQDETIVRRERSQEQGQTGTENRDDEGRVLGAEVVILLTTGSDSEGSEYSEPLRFRKMSHQQRTTRKDGKRGEMMLTGFISIRPDMVP